MLVEKPGLITGGHLQMEEIISNKKKPQGFNTYKGNIRHLITFNAPQE